MSNKAVNNRISRAPIVVVMGHIDHGKSTLLDFIRKSNIVAGEAGGITQHVGAYEAEHVSSENKTHRITFLDTPGHAAFCSIRERGTKAADIAILVVSAEDGVKPQTLEAYNEIKSANIPYIVAINKIDKPNADVDRAKQSLGENEIYVEGWGGDIPCVAISALNGTGVSDLLDMIVLIAEMHELRADENADATGIIVESEMDQKKGISATIIIRDGTLHIGDFIVSGSSFAPVRYIEDFSGKKIQSARPSQPAIIVGWSNIPACGDDFVIVDSKKEAETLARNNADFANAEMRKRNLSATTTSTEAASDDNQPVIIPILIKADTVGSLDGVRHELDKIRHDKVHIHIVSAGIGPINENDIKVALADVANIIVVGFNVMPDSKASAIIERSGVINKNFKIIYELVEYIQNILTSKIPKEFEEICTGRAKILAIFSKEKDRQVIGGRVESGEIGIGVEVRIMRREAEIGRGKVRELQEKKLRTSSVAEGHEFGVMIEAKPEIAVGDRVEAVKMVEKKR